MIFVRGVRKLPAFHEEETKNVHYRYYDTNCTSILAKFRNIDEACDIKVALTCVRAHVNTLTCDFNDDVSN